MSLVSVNAVTILNTCGEPVGGWLSNEEYIINVNNINSTSSIGTYCYDLYNINGLDNVKFSYNISKDDISLQNNYGVFRINANNTNFMFDGFRMYVLNYNSQTPMFLDIYGLSSLPKNVDINMNFKFKDLYFDSYSPSNTETRFIQIATGGNLNSIIKGWEFNNSRLQNDDYIFGIYGSVSYNGGNVQSASVKIDIENINSMFLSEKSVTYYNLASESYCCGAFCSGTCSVTNTGGNIYLDGNNYCYVSKTIDVNSGTDIIELSSSNHISSYYGSEIGELDLFGYKIYSNATSINQLNIPNNNPIIMAQSETYSFSNQLELNSYGNVLDLSFGSYSLDTIWSLNLFYNSLNCFFIYNTSCILNDGSNSQILGYSDNGMITISSNGIIKGIYLTQDSPNDASIISHKSGASYSDVSIVGNNLIRTYPYDNPSIYQTMIDLRVSNLFINNNTILFNGVSQEYNILKNYGNTILTNNVITINSLNGYNNIPNLFIDGSEITIIDNIITLQGNANSDSLRYAKIFDIIGNNFEITDNIFYNQQTNVVKKSSVFDNVGNGYFYHNWLDTNVIPSYDNFTSLKLNKVVGYEYNGKIYEFTIGNYYNGYSNICADVNSDGFCDTPYTLPNGQVDNRTLKSYPYNFQSHLLFANNFFDFQTYNVTLNYIDGQTVYISSLTNNLPITYSHTASVDMICDLFVNNILIDRKTISGNSPVTVNYANWSYETIYDIETRCHSGVNIEKTTGEINVLIKQGTPTTGGGSTGGGGGGGITKIKCNDGDTEQFTCDGGDVINRLICQDGTWEETGESCNVCAWYDFLCDETKTSTNTTSPDGIFSIFDGIFGDTQAEKKKICDIQLRADKTTFTKNGDLIKLTLINNEDMSYTPDYKFVNVEGFNSAIPSFSITNAVGTLQANTKKEVGLKYTVNTFSTESAKDKVIFTHSECADIEVEINTNLNSSEVSFIGQTIGGGSLFGPQVKTLSELFNTENKNIDYIFGAILIAGFSAFNWNKKYAKGSKKSKTNKIIKTIIISVQSLFSGLAILIILNMIL